MNISLRTTRLLDLMSTAQEENTWIIAWGNSPVDVMYITHLYPHILFISAQDIDDHQLTLFERFMADCVPSKIALPFMNSVVGQAIRGSLFPWNPPLLKDAKAIVSFIELALAHKCKHLIVACEYGRSRSVATAHFIKNRYGLEYQNERNGSKRIHRLLDKV